jgi:hypothetical protein
MGTGIMWVGFSLQKLKSIWFRATERPFLGIRPKLLKIVAKLNVNIEVVLLSTKILSEKLKYSSVKLGMLLLRKSISNEAWDFLVLAESKSLFIYKSELVEMVFAGG